VARDGLLVIGYGNPLRGDDGVGPEAARRLRKNGVDALAVHQLTPEIAERIATARAVFFLDADTNLQPGDISVEALHEAASSVASSMEHYVSPAILLRLAHEAYGANPDAWYVAMGGSNFEMGEGLSGDARRAVVRATRAVMRRYAR
jgi:hydrogenase maturation protease